MVLAPAVRDNNHLLGHIDQVDVVPVDDEALPDSDERGFVLSKLISNHIFELTELIGNEVVVTILRKDFGIVAFRRDEHQPVRGNPQQLRVGRYDDELGHDVANIHFSASICKPSRPPFSGIVPSEKMPYEMQARAHFVPSKIDLRRIFFTWYFWPLDTLIRNEI